ncbi:hypothetical protein RmaAA213_03470 [Rhodothermus marinus]|nr:DUF4258 domain-containing protein [Rhodothermus marinus]BBM68501.1 hypothetical protein RmaAA213_03470 [Rhodothermus marinus]BBM71469.1 hypothetical protein RmaAA338_03340 [Rhodothermus marinus]
MLERRGIPLAWVFHPYRIEPDRQDPSLEHRLGPIAAFGNRTLRVVVNVKVNPIRVVTAYFDRRITLV